MKRPREVSIALGMLWLGLGFGAFEALVAVSNRFGLLPFASDGPAGWNASEMVGLLGLLFQTICIVSVGRGHGVVRLPLLIGIGWIASRMGFGEPLQMPEAIAPYHRIEPLGLILHTTAVGLLFLPGANSWFREMQQRRREVGRSPKPVFDQLEPPVE